MVKSIKKDTTLEFDARYQYLEGPNSRGRDLKFAIRAFFQFIKGFRVLHFVGPCISVFGSARTPVGSEMYKAAEEIGKRISEIGFTVMTGGGPGIMEAANKGSYQNGGNSVGCAIKLPKEQSLNRFMDKHVVFDYFFVRKVLLIKYSHAFIIMPGGFGTLDELFETLTLIQTAMLHNFPVVVFGKDYYKNLQALVIQMIHAKTIHQKDMDLILFTDSVDNAMQHITTFIQKNYIIKDKVKPWWILGESKILKQVN